MLTRFRKIFTLLFRPLASALASIGVSPNTITLSSLIFGFLALYSIYQYKSIILYIVFIGLMGLMDALDGAVARLTGKTSKFGAFLDSTTDRINDAFLIYSFKYLRFQDELVVSLMIVSFLISYTRSRGESLGVKMEGVGLIERAERILMLIIAAVAYKFSFLLSLIIVYTLLILSLVTLIQRIIHVYKELGEAEG